MAQKAKFLLLILVVLIIGLVCYAGMTLRSQGNANDYWQHLDPVNVRFDDFGVPTITGKDWSDLIHRQGHVVASERLWQMDLIRRKAGGRLAEWFGKIAVEHDVAMQLENRLEIAALAAEGLPVGERKTCQDYAAGVNDFIINNPGKWGVEYKIIGFEPEPWSCRDTILVLLEMADMLTASADSEARSEPWRRNLSSAWEEFLFSENHPWNKPLFGESLSPETILPPKEEFIAMAPINPEKHANINFDDPEIIGSNNWAWAGSTGKFVANDPHLGQSVPQIWYASRLVIDKDKWIAGVTVPGIPGAIIGMNPHVAWSFTNTGEDVDDYLEEKLSKDGNFYLAKVDISGERWLPVIVKNFLIKVKGEAVARKIEGKFTHRGPLSSPKYLGQKLYSRQWLALNPEALRMPVDKIFLADGLDGLSAAISDMKIPSQNIVAMDRQGNIRYRTSGTGVERKVSGRRPVNAIAGEWLMLKPSSTRPELTLKFSETKPILMATANERIWVDPFGHSWYNDDRKERIVSELTRNEAQTRESMEALQLDTTSRFRKYLLDWIVKRVSDDPELTKKIPKRWRTWDGSSRQDSVTFAELGAAEKEMTKIFLARATELFTLETDKKEEYYGSMKRAWLLTVLMQPGSQGTAVFGIDDTELAQHLIRFLSEFPADKYETINRWTAQHPFVASIPGLGKLFAVNEIDQWGAGDVILAEKPKFGPSMRMVWDLDHPENSTWVFPVGQSGHVWSTNFRNFRKLWEKKKVTSVFPSSEKAAFGF